MESDRQRTPWNKGKLIGQKPSLKLKAGGSGGISLSFRNCQILRSARWPAVATLAGFYNRGLQLISLSEGGHFHLCVFEKRPELSHDFFFAMD